MLQERRERTCDGCSECCRIFDIDTPELQKEAGCPCPNLTTIHAFPFGKECGIYPDRPPVCRDFKCEWLRGYGGDSDKPDGSGIVFLRAWRGNESQLHAFPCDDDLRPDDFLSNLIFDGYLVDGQIPGLPQAVPYERCW